MEVSPGNFPRASTPSVSDSRGKRRPPTTGEYIGYTKVQREANEAKQKALDLEAEATVARTGLAAKARMDRASEEEKRKKRTGDGMADALLASQGDEAAMAAKSVEALRVDANSVAEAVLKVANTSGNLKGTYVKELKVAANVTQNIVDELGRRVSLTGDISHLEAENARLRVEVEDLNGRVCTLEALLEAAKERWGAAPPPSQPTLAEETGVPLPPPLAPGPSSRGAPVPMEVVEGRERAGNRKRRKMTVVSLSDSDEAPPPAGVAGDELGSSPPGRPRRAPAWTSVSSWTRRWRRGAPRWALTSPPARE